MSPCPLLLCWLTLLFLHHALGLVAVRVLLDKRHVLTKDSEGIVQLWDVLAGAPIQQLGQVTRNNRSTVHCNVSELKHAAQQSTEWHTCKESQCRGLLLGVWKYVLLLALAVARALPICCCVVLAICIAADKYG